MTIVDVFVPQKVLAWKAALRRQGYAESTVARKLHGLLTSWKVLYRNGLVSSPPLKANDVNIPEKPRIYTESLNENDFIRFAHTPPQPSGWGHRRLALRDEAMFALQVASPMSTRAMCRINQSDLNLTNGTLNLSSGTVSLPHSALVKLQSHIQATDDLGPSGPLFISCTGRRLDHNTFRRAFQRHLQTCDIPQTPRADLALLSAEQRERFLNTPVSSYPMREGERQRDQLIIDLLGWLGLRPGEIENLIVKDVRISDKRLILRATKSQDDQELPLPEELIPALAAYIDGLPVDMPLFQTSTGQNVGRRQIHAIIRMHGERCGLSIRVNPRILRRSLARILQDKGASQEQIGLLLRHSEYRKTTTARFYARIRACHIAPVLEFHPLRKRATKGSR